MVKTWAEIFVNRDQPSRRVKTIGKGLSWVTWVCLDLTQFTGLTDQSEDMT